MAAQPPTSVTNLATTACTPSVSPSSIARVLALSLYSREVKLVSLRPDNTKRPPWHRLVTRDRSVAGGGVDYVIHRWPCRDQFPLMECGTIGAGLNALLYIVTLPLELFIVYEATPIALALHAVQQEEKARWQHVWPARKLNYSDASTTK